MLTLRRPMANLINKAMNVGQIGQVDHGLCQTVAKITGWRPQGGRLFCTLQGAVQNADALG